MEEATRPWTHSDPGQGDPHVKRPLLTSSAPLSTSHSAEPPALKPNEDQIRVKNTYAYPYTYPYSGLLIKASFLPRAVPGQVRCCVRILQNWH